MQRRGKIEKEGGSSGGGKKSKDGKGVSSTASGGTNAGTEKGSGASGGHSKNGKENFEGTESVASHEDGYVDSDDDDELVFDPIDDVASDETSEPSHSGNPLQMPLDLRGMPMHHMHHPSSQLQPIPAHYANPPVPPGVESLHSANPIDKLYLMQDSYFTQM